MTIKVKVIAVVFLFSVLPCSARAQEPTNFSDNSVSFFRQFLQALYPSLDGKRYGLTVETFLPLDRPGRIPNFAVYVGEGPRDATLGYSTGCQGMLVQSHTLPPSAPSQTSTTPPSTSPQDDCRPSGPIHPSQVVHAAFGFDSKGRLNGFSAEGSAVGRQEADNQFATFVLSHPEFTDDQIIGALKKAGAKYGPDDKNEFVKHLPLKSLERFLGKLDVVSVGYFPLSQRRQTIAGWPDWTLKVRAKREDGTFANYQLNFEPFNGDLFEIRSEPTNSAPK